MCFFGALPARIITLCSYSWMFFGPFAHLYIGSKTTFGSSDSLTMLCFGSVFSCKMSLQCILGMLMWDHCHILDGITCFSIAKDAFVTVAPPPHPPLSRGYLFRFEGLR